jgi:hypothetical protein
MMTGRAVLLVLLALPASARAAGPTSRCLPPRAGEILSAQLQTGAFDAALPAGWTLDHLDPRRESIEVGVVDAQKHPHQVTLKLSGDAPDGKGRSFIFFIDAGPPPDGGAQPPPDAAGRAALLHLASLVDAALPGSLFVACAPVPDQWTSPTQTTDPIPPTLPRNAALLVALLEVLILAGALLLAWRHNRAAPRLSLVERGAIFLGALAAFHHLSGASPVLWIDMLHDEGDVRRCLFENACTLIGDAASVEGVYHEVGWLHFRALAEFVGLGLQSVHLLWQVLSAAGVVLVASAAHRTGGRIAAALSAIFFLTLAGSAITFLAVFNSVPLLFLGAVLLVSCATAAEQGTALSVALAALVAAVLANVHAAGAVTGAAVVWVALLAPRHRWRLAAFGALLFALATFAIGPVAWTRSFTHVWAAHSTAPRPRAAIPSGLLGVELFCTLVGFAAWRIRRRLPRDRNLDAAAALALPMLLALGLGGLAGLLPMHVKYLAHAVAANALLLAVTAAFPLSWLAERAPLRARWRSLAESALIGGAALYLALAHFGPPAPLGAFFNVGDVPEIARELHARNWSWSHVYRSLKGPEEIPLLESFGVLAPDWPAGPPGDDPTNLLVFKVPRQQLPSPLPENWRVPHPDAAYPLVMIFARTALDWNHFEACDLIGDGPPICAASRLALAEHEQLACAYCVPGMPSFATPTHTVRLRIPVRADAAGSAHEIVMRRGGEICGGLILRTPGGVPADDLRASWVTRDGPPGELLIEWQAGTPACQHSYSGFPPFFLEGDPETVRQAARLDPYATVL